MKKKKIFFAFAMTMVYNCSFAQTQTNIFGTTGNAGIGTTSPYSNLQIFEPTGSVPGGVPAATKAVLALSRSGTINYSYNEGAEFRIGHGGPSVWGSQVDFYVNGSSNQSGIPDKQVMSWLYNGYVGIGTTTPKSMLHLMGTFITGGNNANIDPAIPANIPNNLANTGQMLIGWNRTAGAGETDFISNQGGGTVGGFAFYNHDNSNNETQLMWILGNGQVLIGNTQGKLGNYMLAVAGSAIATSVTVKTVPNWPDYVFKKDYRLPSLQEVKTYIEQNRHLPDMPSEQEVAKDGLNLGEINKLLTKKVEELTLYLIEKDQKEKDQEARIKKLEEIVRKLINK